jgi:hypothetical protein
MGVTRMDSQTIRNWANGIWGTQCQRWDYLLMDGNLSVVGTHVALYNIGFLCHWWLPLTSLTSSVACWKNYSWQCPRIPLAEIWYPSSWTRFLTSFLRTMYILTSTEASLTYFRYVW